MAAVEISKIMQIAVPVRNLERAKAFYGDILGLPHLFDAPPSLSFFQCGETRLMLSLPEGPETAGSSIVYYGVADARSACAAIGRQGVPMEEPARPIARVGGKDVWLGILRDSEGNLIGLMSEQAADEARTDAVSAQAIHQRMK